MRSNLDTYSYFYRCNKNERMSTFSCGEIRSTPYALRTTPYLFLFGSHFSNCSRSASAF